MTKDAINTFSKEYYDFYQRYGKEGFILMQKDYNKLHSFYHYTSIDVFYSIIDNYEFWAHNTRFSNDYMEERAVPKSFLEKNEYDIDNYFFCVCTNGDLLSQWRGYCPNGGVSIELSFPEKETNFTIVGNTNPDVSDFYSSPLPIGYTNTDHLAEWKYELKGNSLKFLPLLKNGYFFEELEYRMLFMNKNHFLDKCIFERKLDNLTRVPFIKIKFNKICDMQQRKLPDQINDLLRNNMIKNVDGRRFLTIPACVQQESIYNDISERLKSIEATGRRNIPTILFEGKPPITKITISPMHDRERVREQIEHSCRSRYWLRDVPVVCSEIPYTYSLGKK